MKKYTKRIVSLMMILAVAMTLTATSTVGVLAERAAHGEDAHSPSMSVGSGENPIPDKTTTRENSGGEIVDGPDTEAGANAENGANAEADADADGDADADTDADAGDEEEQKLKEVTDGVSEQVVPGEDDLVLDGEESQQPEWQQRLIRYWTLYKYPMIAGGAVLLIVLFVLIRALIRALNRGTGGAASGGRKSDAKGGGKRAAGASGKYGKRYKK